jgi:enediyne biosynthesis protein E4
VRLLLKAMVAAAASLLLCASLTFADPLGYFPQISPDGIGSGWTYPSGTPSRLGLGVLIADSTLYALSSNGDRIAITPLDTYEQPVQAFPADIDGDGFGDLIVSFRESGSVKLLIGRSDGVSVELNLDSTPLPALSATAACFNSDSLPDLIFADTTRLVILTRDTPGDDGGYAYSFFKEIQFISPTANHPLATQDILTGDFDGDNRTDLIYSGILYINLGKGRILSRQLPVPPGVKVRLLNMSADFDGDNKQELLWSSATGSNLPCAVTVADYDVNNIFRPAKVLQTGLLDITRVFRFDSDGDGLLELGLYSANDARAVAYNSSGGSLDASSATELFSAVPARGQFIGPLLQDSNNETGWLFHNSLSDSIYTGYVRRPYTDATSATGLTHSLAGQAVAVGDYNGDNLPDIYVVNYTGDNALYRGEAGGTFSEVAAEAGVAQGNDGISCAWGDFNNDGHQDLVVAGLWLPDKLFFNRGDGTFADSSHMLHYSRDRQRATSVSWGDVNRDGWLDLLVTNYDGANWLLINHGGRYFDNGGPGLGPTDSFNRTENAAIIDVDRDGWLDIVLLNDDGPVRLLKGKERGEFDDATAVSGLNPDAEHPRFGQSQSWGDFNGDGYPDLFITRAADKAMLFLNNGAGASQRFRLTYSGHPGGGQYARIASAIEDLDSDGRTDLLITRTSQFGANMEIPTDQIFLGDFRGYPPIDSDLTSSANPIGEALVAPLRLKQATSLPVTGDFDRDGDIDILYVNYLPDNPSDRFQSSALPLIYMRNNSGRANTLTVILKRTDNRNLPGTSVRLFHSGRSYWKTVSGGGGRIQSGPFLTFSLGDATTADSMHVHWPDVAQKQTYSGPIYPGELELIVDFTRPSVSLLMGPEGENPDELTTLITASPFPVGGAIGVEDNGGLQQVAMIVLDYTEGTTDTVQLESGAEATVYDFSLPLLAPGDSLNYYFIATDTYGNSSRLPSNHSWYYTLLARESLFIGDINGDGKVNSTDISALLAVLRKPGETITDIEREVADINRDGKVDIFDLLALLKLI